MQKFWEKTKNSVALGLNSIQEATGSSAIQEDASFLELYNQIKESEQKLLDVQTSIKGYSKYVSKMASSQYILSGQIANLFKPDDQIGQISSSAHQAQEQIFTNSRNLSQNYIPTHLLEKINILQNELDPILQVVNKRKRNHVLLNEAYKDLDKAKAKGKIKDIGEYQEKAAKRQKKFSLLDEQFTTLAKAYLSKLPSAYEDIFNAFQFYVTEFFVEGEKQLTSIPSYDFDSQKGKYPSLNELPPVQKQ